MSNPRRTVRNSPGAHDSAIQFNRRKYMKRAFFLPALGAALVLLLAGPAAADINVGVTISTTGPAASLGIPQKNTIELLPSTIAGEKINYVVLDDGSDTTKAVTNARKLVS